MIEGFEFEDEAEVAGALATCEGLAVVAKQRMEVDARKDALWRARRKAACIENFGRKSNCFLLVGVR